MKKLFDKELLEEKQTELKQWLNIKIMWGRNKLLELEQLPIFVKLFAMLRIPPNLQKFIIPGFVGVLLLIIAITIGVAASNGGSSAQVVDASGEVALERAGKQITVKDAVLKNGDIVNMGKSGTVQIRLDDYKVAMLSGAARMELVSAGKSILLKMESGEGLIRIEKGLERGSSFALHTGSIAFSAYDAAVFGVWYTGADWLELCVWQGSVDVTNISGSEIMQVAKGQALRLDVSAGRADGEATPIVFQDVPSGIAKHVEDYNVGLSGQEATGEQADEEESTEEAVVPNWVMNGQQGEVVIPNGMESDKAIPEWVTNGILPEDGDIQAEDSEGDMPDESDAQEDGVPDEGDESDEGDIPSNGGVPQKSDTHNEGNTQGESNASNEDGRIKKTPPTIIGETQDEGNTPDEYEEAIEAFGTPDDGLVNPPPYVTRNKTEPSADKQQEPFAEAPETIAPTIALPPAPTITFRYIWVNTEFKPCASIVWNTGVPGFIKWQLCDQDGAVLREGESIESSGSLRIDNYVFQVTPSTGSGLYPRGHTIRMIPYLYTEDGIIPVDSISMELPYFEVSYEVNRAQVKPVITTNVGLYFVHSHNSLDVGLENGAVKVDGELLPLEGEKQPLKIRAYYR